MGEYFLLFKSAQAEFRCWRNFHHEKKWDIIPIVEFTRGRKRPKAGKDLTEEELTTTLGIFDFAKNVEAVQSDFVNSNKLIVDLTREETLSCAEISQLTNSTDGYARWAEFCVQLRDNGLNNLIPMMIVNPSVDEDGEAYSANIRREFEALSAEFGAVAYRASMLQDTEFVYDLEILRDLIQRHIAAGRHFFLVLDHEFIGSGTGLVHALRTSNVVKGIQNRFPHIDIVIMATSFPRNVTDLGGEDAGNFPIEEAYLYDEIIRQINDNEQIYYGDYGSINPIRNDNVIMRGGWRPRIDFPTSGRQIYYFREKRNEKSYAAHYKSVASKIMSKALPEDNTVSWGIDQIKAAASGTVPASSPSFWISVRMEIFLQRQMSRLAG